MGSEGWMSDVGYKRGQGPGWGKQEGWRLVKAYPQREIPRLKVWGSGVLAQTDAAVVPIKAAVTSGTDQASYG